MPYFESGGGTKWNLLGKKTGIAAIALPSVFKELLVILKINDDKAYSYQYNIPKDILENTASIFRSGGRTVDVSISASLINAYISEATSSGTDYKNTSTITVYYR